jgi:NAD(P)-dependent dehydrogenase (short-subunit alcohol dehydrogenase family)
MQKLIGRIALITGASKGIGQGIARNFAAEGATVILTARSADLLNETVETLIGTGSQALALPADITDEQQVQHVFRQTLDRFGRLDILVNNAGIFDGGPLDQLSLETWEKVMAVNLRGPFLCTREALRVMKEQRSGRIINIGSISAQRVRPYSAPYSASKAGLWGLTQVTALEGRRFGISCGCLHPGNVEVESLAEQRRNLSEPVMSVEEVVQAVITMATLPAHVNMLEAVVLPVEQAFIGRG